MSDTVAVVEIEPPRQSASSESTRTTAEAVDTDTHDRARWVALVVLCVGMLMIVLDATVVNVALPSIQSDLGFTQASLAWVVNAYLIAFGGLLLLAGRLGDLLGRRTILLTGLGVFTTASLACGLAQSEIVLVVARFAQGVGGALTSAVILGMIVTMFRNRGSRRRRSVSMRSLRRLVVPSDCWPEGCSRSRSAGTGSSSSTCLSGSPPLPSRCGRFRPTGASAWDMAPTSWAPS